MTVPRAPYLYSFVVFFLVALLPADTLGAADSAVLQGRILDMSGNPVQGAEVYVYNSPQVKRPADFISKSTADDGRFHIVLPPGEYWALAISRKSGLRYGPLGMGDKHSGEPLILSFEKNDERDIDFVVLDLSEAARKQSKKSSETILISGRIVDSRGKPIHPAYLVADSRQEPTIPAYISAWTDKQGVYTLYLPPGHYYIGAASVFPPARAVSLSRQVILEGDVTGLDVVLGE